MKSNWAWKISCASFLACNFNLFGKPQLRSNLSRYHILPNLSNHTHLSTPNSIFQLNSSQKLNFSTDTLIDYDDSQYIKLKNKYGNKFCRVDLEGSSPIYLCGTLHIAQASVEMVRDVIQSIKPEFVMLELCENRAGTLLESLSEEELNLNDVIKHVSQNPSFKNILTGLLTWLQHKAAKSIGNRLGEEQRVACLEALDYGGAVVLGDRSSDVTLQRVFDKLSWQEKSKLLFYSITDFFTMSITQIKEYIIKTQKDEEFIENEIENFNILLPKFSEVVVRERDEYLAQSLVSLSDSLKKDTLKTPKILAVLGAGHLIGVKNYLYRGGITKERILEISSSSKHPSTWPGGDVHFILDKNTFEKLLQEKEKFQKK